MNGQYRRINILLFCALALVFARSEQAARAESAISLARKGNEHYSHEHYPQATESYRQALMRDPTSPVIQYNLGTSLAKQGQNGEANQILQQAAEVPQASGLNRRDSFFNLGVSLTESAKTQPGQAGPSAQGGGGPNDPSAKNNALQEKITKLNQALGAFRQAILTDPKNDEAKDEAKYNYEIVKAMIRQAQQEKDKSCPACRNGSCQKHGDKEKKQQNKNQKDKQDKDKNQQNQQQQKQDQNEKDKQQQKQDKQQQDEQNQQDKQNQQKDEQDKDRQDKSSDREKDQQKEGEEAKDQPNAPQQQKPQKKEGQNEKPQQANAQPGAGQPQQEPLKPEQMDALRLLNLLEAEKPEQFKELFRFPGKRVERKPDKDW